ncbi:glycoside hydrolase family 99-like domain-containing protein [Methylocystis rosea]|uniref:glycoside hydrolase family 99-like domain-containing protein n=1 Tax=Methylocystis rosea TaxID=173366 RepID=UPI0012EB977B|nr:glycoside hydrolase family 99-like domain-containing protein [Methylocystis rosea]
MKRTAANMLLLGSIAKKATDAMAFIRPEIRRLRGLIDSQYYYAAYPDVAESKIDAAKHYLESGWREGRNPSENFNTIWYLQTYEDAAHSGANPLLHFISCSDRNTRSARPPEDVGPTDWIGQAAKNALLPQGARQFAAGYDLIYRSKLFKPDFYISHYPDVRGDPLEHFIRYGWRLGYNPSPAFSTSRYLQANADVRDAGANPLIHYLNFGAREGRDPKPGLSSLSRSPRVRHAGGANLESKRAIERASDPYFSLYKEQVSVAMGGRDPSYAPLAAKAISVPPNDPSILAFYLPQFHPIPENDRWWGKGFTEWRGVSKAVPQFSGQYQPRLPGELGFYDLRVPDVMARQIELAKLYGVSGFCFHYYWFDGHRLLEKPIEFLLSQQAEEFDFPFCLCWANENWTRRWDGAEKDILMKQNHTPEDHARVFNDLYRFMRDPRYIRVDGKPMIVIYRPTIIPDVENMVQIWRDLAAQAGLPGLYLVATTAFGFDHPEDIGFDAVCQFPPHAVAVREINNTVELLNPDFRGKVYDYGEAVDAYLKLLEKLGCEKRPREYFAGVMMGWDNEARKPSQGHTFHGATPRKFHRWLQGTTEWSKKNNAEGQRFVFINAWNEWAEGTYLEPDRKFGYGYLAAVANVRAEGLSNEAALSSLARRVAAKRTKKAKIVLCIHVFYEDLIEEFAAAVNAARKVARMDVIASIPNSWDEAAARKLIDLLDPVRVVVSENKGRDIWPFLQALRIADGLGYEIGCKLHSKKSTHLSAGHQWRRGLLDGLIGRPDSVKAALAAFAANQKVGLVAPTEAMFSIRDPVGMRDNKINVETILSKAGLEGFPLRDFVAGSMFWFRLSAMKKVADLPYEGAEFGPELGAIDGTFAHAFERLFPTLVAANGFTIANYASTSTSAAAPY